MNNKRRRLWTDFEDMVLALNVLHFRREGYTYAAAFKAATGSLNRTAQACSSRWYRKIRYITASILQKQSQLSKHKKETVGA